jgi:hypothetical protein
VLGCDRIERDERGVWDPLGKCDPVPCALEERDADNDAMADHERRQVALLDVGEGGGDADALLGEGLAARESKVRITVDEASETVGVFGLHVGEQAIGPVAGVSLHQTWVLAWLKADSLGDYVGGFPCSEQWAAPQRSEVVGACPLGKVDSLRAACVVQAYRHLTLEAALQVVGGLAMACEVDVDCRNHGGGG